MINRVFEFKELTLEYESTGATSAVVFSTDLPGGAMASRATPTLAITTTRANATFPLDGISGRMFQTRVTPGGSAVCKLYKGSVKARPIGVYLDGSKSEYWESLPTSPGA